MERLYPFKVFIQNNLMEKCVGQTALITNLKKEYNQKLYSESDKNNFVREAIAQTKEEFFDLFRPQVESLILKRLLDFCQAHPAITSMDSKTLPTVDCTQ